MATYVKVITDRKEFEQKAQALRATVRVLRTTRTVPVRISSTVLQMRPLVAIEYSFEEPSEGGDVRWLYRERWLPDPKTGRVDLSHAMVEEKPANITLVMTHRSGSF